MNSKSWCNIRNQMNMSGSKLLLFTLIISIVWTSGALANDQRSSSLSDSRAVKLQQKNNDNKHIYIDNEDDLEGSGRKGEVQNALENEDDNDDSGSGGFGDDEDDIGSKRNEKPYLNNKPDQTSHHSGDGSDHKVDSESTGDEDVDYNENHEDHTPLHTNPDDIYFDNSTDTVKPLSPTTTDDEDIGGGIDSRPKEHYPNRGSDPFDNGPHVPLLTPTEQPAGGSDNVLIMNTANEDRTTSFFAQPGILAAVIGGAVVGLLFAILVVMFIVYRMRKKDEGSYALDEPQKRSPQANSYTKNHNNREFYA